MTRFSAFKLRLRSNALLISSLGVSALFAIAYRNVLQLGILAYGDTQPWPTSWQASLNSFSNAWTQGGLGERSNFGPLSLFIALILWLLADNYYLAQKLFLFSLLPLAYVSSVVLLRGLVRSRFVVSVASFAYSVNPLTLQEFLGGAQGLLLTYATLPLVAHFTIELRKRPTINNTLKLTILMTLVSAFNFQAPSIVLLGVVPFLFVSFSGKDTFSQTKFLKYLACLLSAISLPVIFSLILQQSALQLSIATRTDILADYRGLNLAGILLFLGPSFALLASSAAFSCEQRLVALRTYLLGVSAATILFIYLTSLGITAELFLWMPILLVYRASVKLLYPLAFAFALLAAFFLDSLMAMRISVSKPWRAAAVGGRPAIILLLIVLPVVLYHNNQLLTGNLGLSNSAQLDDVFEQARIWLDMKRPSGYFRTLWLPQDIQTDYALRAFDPDTFILRSGSVPNPNYNSPAIQYATDVMRAIANGSDAGIGMMLSYAAVKYVIVNFESSQTGSPHLLYDWLTYFAKGDPRIYQEILDAQIELRQATANQHFSIYENTAFRPHVAAYNRLMILHEEGTSGPPKVLATYTENLVRNPEFTGNFSGWETIGAGQWVHVLESGHAAALGMSEKPWTFMVQQIPVNANSSFLFSANMRLANASQSHIKIEWYDESGHFLSTSFPQTGISGDRDWFTISSIVFSPPRTSTAKLYFGAGGGLLSSQVGVTWFTQPALKQAFVRFPYSSNHFESFVSYRLSTDRTLLAHSSRLDSNTLTDLKNSVETDVIYAGSGELELFELDTIGGGLVRHTIIAAGGVTNFSPVNGTWSSFPERSSSYAYVARSDDGTISTVFKTGTADLYRLSLRFTAGSTAIVQFDDSSILPTESYGDGIGFERVDYVAMRLSEGLHVVTIKLRGGLDSAYLYSIEDEQDTLRHSYDKTSFFEILESGPSKHVVSIGGRYGSVLYLGESFDLEWQAQTNQSKLDHIPGTNHYSWGNIFLLRSGGEQVVTIHFSMQNPRNTLIASYVGFWFLILGISGTKLLAWCLRNARNVRRVILRRL